MNNETVISVEHFKKQFGKLVVLENINLKVKKRRDNWAPWTLWFR